jgi:hypothetical protein
MLATGTSRSASPPMSRTGTRTEAIISQYRPRRPTTRISDRDAARNASSLDSGPWLRRSAASAIDAANRAGSIRDGSAKQSSMTRWTASCGGRRDITDRTYISPRPGSAYIRNWLPTTRSGTRGGSGRAGSISTSPATVSGAPDACMMEIRPPIELPARITGVPVTSRTKRSSSLVLAWTVDVARVPGVRPNPRRSSATARRPSASRGPIRHQFRCEPPRPCTNTIGAALGAGGWRPGNSIQCTGPSRSVT